MDQEGRSQDRKEEIVNVQQAHSVMFGSFWMPWANSNENMIGVTPPPPPLNASTPNPHQPTHICPLFYCMFTSMQRQYGCPRPLLSPFPPFTSLSGQTALEETECEIANMVNNERKNTLQCLISVVTLVTDRDEYVTCVNPNCDSLLCRYVFHMHCLK